MVERKESMTDAVWQPLAAVDRKCFGCGPENPHGLRMRFESNGTMLRSTVKMEQRFRGWSNLIHGGILSTLLDEMMGWTVIILTGKFMLTRSMKVAFRRPVYIGAVLTVTGSIKERVSDKRVLVQAEIRDEEGRVCAESEGEFALFNREQFLRMGIMPEADLDVMAAAIS